MNDIDWEEIASDAEPAPAGADLVDPLTGEIPRTIDEHIESWDRCRQEARRLENYARAVAQRLASMCEADTKTRRLRGDRRRVRIEMPDDSWDQSKLKEAWTCYPKFRDEFMTISSLRVKLREFKKVAAEVGEPDFETFRQMLMSANRGPTGTPRVVVEE